MFGVGCLGTSIAEPFLRIQAAGIVPGINHTRSEPFVYSGLIGWSIHTMRSGLFEITVLMSP